MKDSEQSWVEFSRLVCLEGYIDVWIGDCINSPNNPEKSKLNLNAMVTYFRLNNKSWVRSDSFTRNFQIIIRSEMSNKTADCIWKENFVD